MCAFHRIFCAAKVALVFFFCASKAALVFFFCASKVALVFLSVTPILVVARRKTSRFLLKKTAM